jgi:transcription elongation factor Elf1
MSDDEHGDDSLAAALCASPDLSTREESPHMHTFLRCPECGHVLKWIFVEQTTINGEHNVHRCQASCNFETLTGCAQVRHRDGYVGEMVQVDRVSW